MPATIEGTTAMNCTPAGAVLRADAAERLAFPDGSLMRLLGEGVGNTTHSITAHHAVIAAGTDGAGAHHHQQTSELIYVLRGSLDVLVDDDLLVARQGDLVVIPPGVVHAFAATGDGDAELLDIVSPGIERFELFRHIHRLARRVTTTDTFDIQNQFDIYADESAEWRRRGN